MYMYIYEFITGNFLVQLLGLVKQGQARGMERSPQLPGNHGRAKVGGLGVTVQ